jgi:glyoxylase-like metal-dependent hydrolase (beta-lactamase superfamily II)
MRSFTFGDVKVHVISAGYYLGDVGVMYGIVPKALWSPIEPPDADNLVRFEMQCLLIEANGLRTLVDNGYGTKLDEKIARNLHLNITPGLVDDLHALGLEPEDVDLVVDTHLHADHCGGNTGFAGEEVVPAFPKARYVIQRGEFDVASTPNERTRATYLQENFRPLEDAGVVDFVSGDFNVTPSVRMEVAPGHTRDHCIVRVAGGGQTALFLADLVQRPVMLERIAWVAAYDIEPLVSLETKRRVVEEAAREGHLLILQHSSEIGRLRKNDAGRTVWESC